MHLRYADLESSSLQPFLSGECRWHVASGELYTSDMHTGTAGQGTAVAVLKVTSRQAGCAKAADRALLLMLLYLD